MSVPTRQQEVETATQASSSWSAAFPPGWERGSVLTVPDPDPTITVYSLPSLLRKQRPAHSAPRAPGCCQRLQRFQREGFSWPQRLHTSPMSPSAESWAWTLVVLLMGGRVTAVKLIIYLGPSQLPCIGTFLRVPL